MSFRLQLEELTISKKLTKMEEWTLCNEKNFVCPDYFSLPTQLNHSKSVDLKLLAPAPLEKKLLTPIPKKSITSTPLDSIPEWRKDFETLKQDVGLSNSILTSEEYTSDADISETKHTYDNHFVDKNISDTKHFSDNKNISDNKYFSEHKPTVKQKTKNTTTNKTSFFSSFSWGSGFFSRFFSKKIEKYEIMPTDKQASFVIFSMQSLPQINPLLKRFPHQIENKLGCSAILVWTGIKNYNVPVEHGNESIGIVLDAKYLDIPQAHMGPKDPTRKVEKEILKADAFDWSVTPEKKLITKYPHKAGYYKYLLGEKIFVTNIACNQRPAGGKTTNIYHATGSASVLSQNIWRKFFKPQKPNKDPLQENGIMFSYNATVYQNSMKNPIDGLMITKTLTKVDAQALALILKENSTLKLYFYNIHAEEHIMRYLDNREAIDFLDNTSRNFDIGFEKATPYGTASDAQKIVLKK